MGHVAEVFKFHYLHAGQKFGLNIGWFGFDDFVAFSIVPELERNPQAGAGTGAVASVTEGPTSSVPVVGVGRQLFIENQSPGAHPFISVKVMRFKQSPFD